MGEYQAIWNKVCGWYGNPHLKAPRMVKGLGCGAACDFRKRETLIDDGFVDRNGVNGDIQRLRFVEGLMAHAIGHHTVFPRDLETCILAGKWLEEFFGKEHGHETLGFIFQTYSDMANDLASALRDWRVDAILNFRTVLQAGYDDPLNHNVREVMLAYLNYQAGRAPEPETELKPFFDRMMEIDFLSEDPDKLHINLYLYGKIIIEMIEKYGQKGGSGSGKCGLVSDHGDSDLKGILGGASDSEMKDALKSLSGQMSQLRHEKITNWLGSMGMMPPDISRRRIFRYRLEEEACARALKVDENPALKAIEEAWTEFDFKYCTKLPGNPDSAVDPSYRKALAIAARLRAAPEDIELFSIALMKYSDEQFICEKSGVFLSALMNASDAGLFLLRTSHLDFAPWFLGYRNTKDFLVDGDSGDFFCSRMSGGLAELSGNAGKFAGMGMSGGKMLVYGDCEGSVGMDKTGGEIIVKGRIR